MRRTNVVLEEWQYQYLKERAAREGKSLSALIRELIEAAVRPEGNIKDDPIFEIVGMAEGTGRDIARRHDEILYRKDWES
jgi:plasmid stability protein